MEAPHSLSPPTASRLEGATFLDVLDIEEIDRDLYRSSLVFADRWPLYGGQVAAQALKAAGLTVAPDRQPHSLHGYFLRGGDAAKPTLLRVERDRDGRSYSARRVIAIQGGEVIFNMSASFHVAEDGPDVTVAPAPMAPAPEDLPEHNMSRLYSFEARVAPSDYPDSPHPTRIWARATIPLGDDHLTHACALTYLSDLSTGLGGLADENAGSGSSLDHAVWLHRHVRMDEWVLMDLVPHSVAGGRGWYTGSVYGRDGVLAASLAQEMLFRTRRPA
jgi:acyl-CoA thioesterase-2